MKFDSTLYFVTDSSGKTDEEFLAIVEKACRGGATLVQVREKERGSREYLRLARLTKQVTDRFNIPLIINDRVDIAVASGADGVHVGQSDLPVDDARRLIGPDKIVGATAKTVEQALEAYESGADYLSVGAVYPRITKPDDQLISVETLDAICMEVPLKVLAIGGLNAKNLHILDNSRISGIMLSSAIIGSPDPGAAAAELYALSHAIVRRNH